MGLIVGTSSPLKCEAQGSLQGFLCCLLLHESSVSWTLGGRWDGTGVVMAGVLDSLTESSRGCSLSHLSCRASTGCRIQGQNSQNVRTCWCAKLVFQHKEDRVLSLFFLCGACTALWRVYCANRDEHLSGAWPSPFATVERTASSGASGAGASHELQNGGEGDISGNAHRCLGSESDALAREWPRIRSLPVWIRATLGVRQLMCADMAEEPFRVRIKCVCQVHVCSEKVVGISFKVAPHSS